LCLQEEEDLGLLKIYTLKALDASKTLLDEQFIPWKEGAASCEETTEDDATLCRNVLWLLQSEATRCSLSKMAAGVLLLKPLT